LHEAVRLSIRIYSVLKALGSIVTSSCMVFAVRLSRRLVLSTHVFSPSLGKHLYKVH